MTYRTALRSWRDLGLPFDEALTAVDMATLLDPADAEVRAAAESARETLGRLGARPFLTRLEAALARTEPVEQAAADADGIVGIGTAAPL